MAVESGRIRSDSGLLGSGRLRGGLEFSRRRRCVLRTVAHRVSHRMPHWTRITLHAAAARAGGSASRGAAGGSATRGRSAGRRRTGGRTAGAAARVAVAMGDRRAMRPATAAAVPRGGFIGAEKRHHQGGGQHRGGSHHVSHSRISNKWGRSTHADRRSVTGVCDHRPDLPGNKCRSILRKMTIPQSRLRLT